MVAASAKIKTKDPLFKSIMDFEMVLVDCLSDWLFPSEEPHDCTDPWPTNPASRDAVPAVLGMGADEKSHCHSYPAGNGL